MVKSTVNLFAMVLGVLVLLPLAACERAQGATETAAEAAREAVGEAMEDAEEESEEATDELVEVQGRFVDKGDGTVRDNKTGLIWLRNANCAAPGPGSWDEAMAAAVALRDKPPGQSDACGLSDGSKAGDWRLPTIKEFCSAWSGENSSRVLRVRLRTVCLIRLCRVPLMYRMPRARACGPKAIPSSGCSRGAIGRLPSTMPPALGAWASTVPASPSAPRTAAPPMLGRSAACP